MQFVMPRLSIHSLDLLGQGIPTSTPTLNQEEPTPEPTDKWTLKYKINRVFMQPLIILKLWTQRVIS
jgi:hypothetical protein